MYFCRKVHKEAGFIIYTYRFNELNGESLLIIDNAFETDLSYILLR